MAIELQDTLKAEFVLVGVDLLNDQDKLNAFATSIRTDVEVAVPGPLLIPGGLGVAQMIRLPRDRIIIQTSEARSIVRRDYPSNRNDLDRLAEVANGAISHTESSGEGDEQLLQAFGFNVDIVYSQTSGLTAAQYLANRLFAPDILAESGMSVVGGGGRIDLSGDGCRWGISIEPRYNNPTESRVFLSVNMHRDEQVMPDPDNIRDSLRAVWDQARRFAHLLDEKE